MFLFEWNEQKEHIWFYGSQQGIGGFISRSSGVRDLVDPELTVEDYPA